MIKFWNRRWFRIAAAVIAVLLVIQFGTFFVYGRRTMPRAAMRHCLRPTGYVVIEAETWASLTTAQQASLTTYLDAHASARYRSIEEVPVARTVRAANTDQEVKLYRTVATQSWRSPAEVEKLRKEAEAKDHLVKFVDGYQLSWRSNGEGLFWMRSWVTYYGGFDDAAGNESLYVWVLGLWVRVRDEGGFVT